METDNHGAGAEGGSTSSAPDQSSKRQKGSSSSAMQQNGGNIGSGTTPMQLALNPLDNCRPPPPSPTVDLMVSSPVSPWASSPTPPSGMPPRPPSPYSPGPASSPRRSSGRVPVPASMPASPPKQVARDAAAASGARWPVVTGPPRSERSDSTPRAASVPRPRPGPAALLSEPTLRAASAPRPSRPTPVAPALRSVLRQGTMPLDPSKASSAPRPTWATAASGPRTDPATFAPDLRSVAAASGPRSVFVADSRPNSAEQVTPNSQRAPNLSPAGQDKLASPRETSPLRVAAKRNLDTTAPAMPPNFVTQGYLLDYSLATYLSYTTGTGLSTFGCSGVATFGAGGNGMFCLGTWVAI